MHAPLAVLACLALCAGSALPQEPPGGLPPTKPYKFNQRVEEEPNLPDLEGKNHPLYAESKDQALLFVFWSYKDPVSRFYAPQLAEIERKRAGKLKVVLVNSNYDELVTAGDPLAKLKKVVAAEKVTLPLLLDHENRLADDFGATANGQCFLLDANHYLRYHGGIDDDPDGKRRKEGIEVRTWLENALDEVLAGKPPTENWTRPSGRPIKRAPATQAQPAGGPAPRRP